MSKFEVPTFAMRTPSPLYLSYVSASARGIKSAEIDAICRGELRDILGLRRDVKEGETIVYMPDVIAIAANQELPEPERSMVFVEGILPIRKAVVEALINRGARVIETVQSPNFFQRSRSTGWVPLAEDPTRVVKFSDLTHVGEDSLALQHQHLAPERVFRRTAGIFSFAANLSAYPTIEDLNEAARDQDSRRKILQLLAHGMKGCAYMHDQGVAHADFKPGNVLDCEGTGKLFDFEAFHRLCLGHEPSPADSRYLDVQYFGKSQVGHFPARDVFAAGISILEILTGEKNLNHKFGKIGALPDEAMPRFIKGFQLPTELERLLTLMTGFSRESRPDMNSSAEQLERLVA